jgi:hypothetical protein
MKRKIVLAGGSFTIEETELGIVAIPDDPDWLMKHLDDPHRALPVCEFREGDSVVRFARESMDDPIVVTSIPAISQPAHFHIELTDEMVSRLKLWLKHPLWLR